MTISQKGLDFIANEEGVVLHAYKDAVGIPTIGIGTTVYPDGRKVSIDDPAITYEQAKEYLAFHLEKRTYPYINAGVKITLSQSQFDVLCSFIYNIGGVGFENSTLLKKINAGAPCSEIHEQFLRWKNAGGKPILLGRRTREANLYC